MWKLRTIVSPNGHKEMYSLTDELGNFIWPVGLGYVNYREMLKHEEGFWKMFPKSYRSSRHKAKLAELAKRAGFDFFNDQTVCDMNSVYPTACQPPSLEHARLGAYMSEAEHQRKYPGEPYNKQSGRGRIPVDQTKLHQEVVNIVEKWNSPFIHTNEFMWASRTWKNWSFEQALTELVESVKTIRAAAPNILIMWPHAFTKLKDQGYWTLPNLTIAFEEFRKAGGDMITINWYPIHRTPPAPTDPRFQLLQGQPSGWSEFAPLTCEDFKRDVEGSERGMRSLVREGRTQVTPEAEYNYPTTDSWPARLERLEAYLRTCAVTKDCIMVSPYGGVDHVAMAWGHLFNPYTWEEYPVDEIGAIVDGAKQLREDTFGLGYKNLN